MIDEPIISVDWLQFFVDLSEFQLRGGYNEEVLAVKARTFSEVVDLYHDQTKLGQICRKPYSSVLSPTCGTLKIENEVLYMNNAVRVINAILEYCKIRVLSVTRVDLCGDFEEIAEMPPHELIMKLVNHDLLKVGHSRMYFHGEDMWRLQGLRQISDKCWVGTNSFECVGTSSSERLDYLRYGTNRSNVVCYLYNKSKELREVKDKPYIRHRWGGSNGDVWRLEFSIKGRRLSFIEKESGCVLPNDWEMYFTPAVCTYYVSLADHYFNIRENTEQVRKDREKKVQLFGRNLGSVCAVLDISKKHPSNRADRIYVRKTNEEMILAYNRGEVELAKSLMLVGLDFVTRHDLKEWCNRHGIYFEQPNRVVQATLPTTGFL